LQKRQLGQSKVNSIFLVKYDMRGQIENLEELPEWIKIVNRISNKSQRNRDDNEKEKKTFN